MNPWVIIDTIVLIALLLSFASLAWSSRRLKKAESRALQNLLGLAVERYQVDVGVKLLDPAAKVPAYSHAGDSGMDVASIDTVTIAPHSFALVRTGVAMVIPRGFEIQVRPRSGLQCKIGVVGAWGTVDEGYRGGIGVALYNHGDKPFEVKSGDRVAQLVVAPVCRAVLNPVDDLGETDRGANGFGSTGK